VALVYTRPCKTREIRDDFKDHQRRGSKLPGLDYACATGDRVFSTAVGRVVGVSNVAKQVMGRHIIIKHPDGRKSYYLHLSVIRVKVGERVQGGDNIALSGNTGTTTTGPHLHFSIRNRFGILVDPLKLLRRRVITPRPNNGKGPAVKGIPG
jgi:murein DD-endopeptidase MepM/ murein hydrolase activator NlpD